MTHTVVLVPIYQPVLSALEQFSLDHSLPLLAEQGREVFFIGPKGLDLAYYARRYPGVAFEGYDPSYFGSIRGYNLLLLDPGFYERYARCEFLLILQTDAVLLRDDLDHWASLPYDYVGAPWPQGLPVKVNLDRFEGGNARTVRALVGNGGLSLRRVRACQALLREFPLAAEHFRLSGSSEDLFFAVMGLLSAAFVLPNERVASLFAWELSPEHYHAVNGVPPMGGHAWWKYNPDFWTRFFRMPPPPSAGPSQAVSSPSP
jgi:Protein of unknown function (DUF5672)